MGVPKSPKSSREVGCRNAAARNGDNHGLHQVAGAGSLHLKRQYRGNPGAYGVMTKLASAQRAQSTTGNEIVAVPNLPPDDIQPVIPEASTLMLGKPMARARRADCGAFAQKKLEQ